MSLDITTTRAPRQRRPVRSAITRAEPFQVAALSRDQDEIILAGPEFLFPSVFHYDQEPLVMARAKDQYVWDAGRTSIPRFFGASSHTLSVFRSNDEGNTKVDRQLDTLQRVSTLFATEPQAAIAKKIALLTRGGQLSESLFTNGGTEANETDILSARCFTGNTEIVAFRHFYHGRTATGDDAYRATWRARPAAGRHRARRITRTATVVRSASPIPRAKSNARRISEELVGSSTGYVLTPPPGLECFSPRF